jgi:AcrR family transcriptional regulator
MAESIVNKVVDFRVRVAREKRERMRHRLLRATMSVCSRQDRREPATVDDVIGAAEVARGTFYKYFSSLDEAIDDVGRHLGEETVANLQEMLTDIDDPALGIAIGAQFLTTRAAIEPIWGGFICNTNHLTHGSTLVAAMRANAANGEKRGQFQFRCLEAAVDAQMGIVMQGVRRMLEGERRQAYVLDVASMSLKALGLPAERADALADDASAILKARAPAFLDWWRPLS